MFRLRVATKRDHVLKIFLSTTGSRSRFYQLLFSAEESFRHAEYDRLLTRYIFICHVRECNAAIEYRLQRSIDNTRGILINSSRNNEIKAGSHRTLFTVLYSGSP